MTERLEHEGYIAIAVRLQPMQPDDGFDHLQSLDYMKLAPQFGDVLPSGVLCVERLNNYLQAIGETLCLIDGP
jgi:hypothetical protein